MMNYLRLICWSLLFGLSFHTAHAQLTVNATGPFRTYIADLVGPGIDLISIDSVYCDTVPPNLLGNSVPIGQFSATGSPLGLTSGVLLTSGSIDNALPGGVNGDNIAGPGDPNLNGVIAPDTTNDACGFKVTIRPSCDTIIIRYVFASNEYPAFVATFNDPMGIFVTGPGYAPFTNVALVPNTTQNVSIFNVNATTNTAFYRPNGAGSNYNGTSVVLEAIIPVIACEEYTIDISVADEQDFAFDTGVFIEPFSCGSPIPKVLARNFNNPNSTETREECVDGYFTFFNTIDTTQDLTFNLTFLGTAVNGVDFNMPTTVTVPAGEDSIDIPANIVNDGIAEGTETIIVALDIFSCDTPMLTILDPFVADGLAGNDTTFCANETNTIGVTAVPGYSYSWGPSFGFVGPSSAAEPQVGISSISTPIGANYIVEVTEQNGCTDSDSVFITYSPGPPAAFFADATICEDDFATIQYSLAPNPALNYNWNFGPSTDLVIGNGPGPYQVSWLTPGPKTITLVVDDNFCNSQVVTQTVQVNPTPTSAFQMPAQACEGEPVQLVYLGSGSSSNASFTWDIDGGNGAPNGTSFQVTWGTPGLKTIRLRVEENGCESVETVQTINIIPTPATNFVLQDSICQGDLAQITYTGANGPSGAYTWSFGDAIVASGSGSGPYLVAFPFPGTKQVCLQVNDQGCASPTVCRDIEVVGAPSVAIDPVSAQCFNGNIFTFTQSGDPAQSYQWDFGDGATPQVFSGATPPNVVYNTPGVKTVTLTAAGSGCLGGSTTLQVEVVPEPTADFQFTANAACLNENVDFTYAGTILGPTQSFVWEFGPGAIPSSSSLPNPPSVTYTSGGQKDVKLTVTYNGCVQERMVSIQVNPGPVVSAGLDREFCEGDGGALLDASVSGGTSPYFYTWNCAAGGSCGIDSTHTEDPIVNPTIASATEDVTYYFQVTDVNGCRSAVDSVTVTIKAKPKLDAGADVAICPADAPGLFLQGALANDNAAPEPMTYQWTPSVGLSNPTDLNAFARPDTTTIYTLTAVSVNGCTSQATTIDPRSTMTVKVKPEPSVEAGVDTGICVGGQIQLGAFANSAGPDYEYIWSPALPGTIDDETSATPIVSPGSSTTYTVVVTSDGCTGSDSVRVQVDTQPTVEAGDNRDICQTEALVLDGEAAGDPDATIYNYSWSPSIGLSDSTLAQPSASPMVTTQYILTATTDAGCRSEPDTVTIDVLPTPVVDIVNGDMIICEGEQIKLVAQHSYTTGIPLATDYSWDPLAAIITNESDSVVVMSPTTSTYITVSASSFTGRCVATDRVLVEVNPAVLAEIAADTNRICEGDRLELKGLGSLGAADFEWLPAGIFDNPATANPLASPSNTTMVQLVLSEGVCTDTASFELQVVPTPQADYFSSLTEGCGELTVQFQQNTPDAESYIWDFGDGSPLSNEPSPAYTYSTPGTYIVSLTTTGEFGCETTVQSITVSLSELPDADFISTPTRENTVPLPEATFAFEDQSDNAVAWYWEFGDGNISREQNPSHTYTDAGSYQVKLTITDASGCNNSVSYGIYEVIMPELTVPNVFSPNGDGKNDQLVIDYTGTERYTFEVSDRWGRRVYRTDSGSNNFWDGNNMNGTRLPEGVYYYTLILDAKVYRGEITLLR